MEHEEAGRRLSRAREVRARLLEADSVVARSDGSVRSLTPNSVTGAQGAALRNWVEREDAASTIETGLGYGISALFICEGLLRNGHPEPRHVAIDPHQSTGCSSVGLQVLEEAGLLETLEFHEGESELVLPRFVTEGRRFDLAFVDGHHRFDGVFLDLVYLARLVRGGGVIVVDDLQLPAVERATRFCTTNLGWKREDGSQADELHHWAVFRMPETAPERSYDFYVDF